MDTLISLNKKNTDTRITVVQTLALSIINYCSNIWGSTNKTQVPKAQPLCRKSGKPQYKQIKWLKVKQKCQYDVNSYINSYSGAILIGQCLYKLVTKRVFMPGRLTLCTSRYHTRNQGQDKYKHRSETTYHKPLKTSPTWLLLKGSQRNFNSQWHQAF